MEFYQKSVDELLIEFDSEATKGLCEKEVALRLAKYGPNKLRQIRRASIFVRFLGQFKDILTITLIVAAFLALLIGEARDFYIIMGIVLLNATIGFIQEYKAEKILSAFKKHLPSYVKVYRDNKLKKILASQLVVGDIVDLDEGDAIGADARLIEAYNFRANEFSLTGEMRSRMKKIERIKRDKVVGDRENMVFMGTSVAQGKARAIVVATGMNTEFGKIAENSQSIKENITPLQKELMNTGNITIRIAAVMAVVTIIIFHFMGRTLFEGILFALACAVAVVPEGLPAAVSVALSLGAQRMLKKKALVKTLLHVESLGSVTTICTDKTGTLTTGEMTVVEIYHDGFNSTADNNVHFYNGLTLCNDANLNKIGDPLEVALLNFVEKNNRKTINITASNPRIFDIPFTSLRKMMSVVCNGALGTTVYSKGAPLEILKRCNISMKDYQGIVAKNDEMAKKGLRVIALAFKPIEVKEHYGTKEIESNLQFCGLIGLKDPARRGVSEAIQTCQLAGIKVHMVTGDYGLTALAIGLEIGLADEHTVVISGEQLHRMDDSRLKKIMQKATIFARIDPDQKLRIVEVCQKMKEVVAVTGDGVNDAPALVKADIGIAMGKIGTDVAKEAADMILLDDHFGTIVSAIGEGRRIFDNARKFVFFVFSSNSGELFISLIGMLLGFPLPLIAVQVLAIDLGADVFPSLALGAEDAEPGIMTSAPRSRGERIMNTKLLGRLFMIGIFMAILGLCVFVYTLYLGGWHYGESVDTNGFLYFQATASSYATLVLCQAINALSCRSDKRSIFKMNLFSNKLFVYSELTTLALLICIMTVPVFKSILRTENPPLNSWLMIAGAVVIFAFFVEWIKRINEKFNNKTVLSKC
ncbi:MAG: cation-transporting P-type ATPase [bacterium]